MEVTTRLTQSDGGGRVQSHDYMILYLSRQVAQAELSVRGHEACCLRTVNIPREVSCERWPECFVKVGLSLSLSA